MPGPVKIVAKVTHNADGTATIDFGKGKPWIVTEAQLATLRARFQLLAEAGGIPGGEPAIRFDGFRPLTREDLRRDQKGKPR